MNRRTSLVAMAVLVASWTLAGSSAQAQSQVLTGKWVHEGPRGVSMLDFYPAEKGFLPGTVRGAFQHTLMLEDGRVLQGVGHYVLHRANSNHGRLVLHFSDGHVTREHEHQVGCTTLRLEHHGHFRMYTRQ